MGRVTTAGLAFATAVFAFLTVVVPIADSDYDAGFWLGVAATVIFFVLGLEERRGSGSD